MTKGGPSIPDDISELMAISVKFLQIHIQPLAAANGQGASLSKAMDFIQRFYSHHTLGSITTDSGWLRASVFLSEFKALQAPLRQQARAAKFYVVERYPF